MNDKQSIASQIISRVLGYRTYEYSDIESYVQSKLDEYATLQLEKTLGGVFDIEDPAKVGE